MYGGGGDGDRSDSDFFGPAAADPRSPIAEEEERGRRRRRGVGRHRLTQSSGAVNQLAGEMPISRREDGTFRIRRLSSYSDNLQSPRIPPEVFAAGFGELD